MKDSEIYRRAAELVDESEYRHSCCAIDEIVDGKNPPLRAQYDYLFNARNGYYAWGNYFGGTLTEIKSCRVLALLFMAAICEAEGR